MMTLGLLERLNGQSDEFTNVWYTSNKEGTDTGFYKRAEAFGIDTVIAPHVLLGYAKHLGSREDDILFITGYEVCKFLSIWPLQRTD